MGNRAKHFLVLFGLMAVSLTCIFFLGGPGTRRRLVGPKQMLDVGATLTGFTFFPENDKVLVIFKLLDVPVAADTTAEGLLTMIDNGEDLNPKQLEAGLPLLETAVRRDLRQLREFPGD